MCNTDVFFPIFYWSGWFPAHLDGLWSVRGHLPPSPLQHCHGTGAVHLTSNCVLDSLLCQCPVSHPPPDWLSLCADHSIPHFFCDLGALLKLSCSDTSLNELAIFTVGVAVIVLPLVCILISYGCIGATILKVPSTKGICKALSTCGSHFSVVSPYYGTILGLYIFPSSSTSRDKITIASVMYTVLTPLLNPFIHSLRNRDMKGALERLLHRAKVLSRCLLIFITATCVHTNPRAYIATFEPGKKWILSEWPLDCILLQLLFPYNLLV